MKRIIFTLYDDLNEVDDTYNLGTPAVKLVNEYLGKLVQNKKDYADSIGVDFRFYHNTMKDFECDVSLEFTKVNLYKHYVMGKLAEEYDEVLYVDMDVVLNTKDNMFDEHDLENNGYHIKYQDDDVQSTQIEEILFSEIGLRSPTLKYHITKAMLGGEDSENIHVMNTGIMLANSKWIRKLDFVNNMQVALNRLEEIKRKAIKENEQSYLTLHFYPNNEALFAWMVLEYDIPFYNLDNEWHCIVDHVPKQYNFDDMKAIHFINKKFNSFFKDKTYAMFSIHIDIPDDKLDNPRGHYQSKVTKSKHVKDQLAKYKNILIDNHKEEAKAINATYIHYGRDEQYEEFYKRFPDLSEYDVINLYKIWLLDKLTKEYDGVLYVDLDCYFTNTGVSIFDYVPWEVGFCCHYSTIDDLRINKSENYFRTYEYDFRSPHAKYWNTHALLAEGDIDKMCDVYNTGVMVASREAMDKLDYFSDIGEVLSTMKELKEDEHSMYPPQIRKSFGYDNETITAYKIAKNNVFTIRLKDHWHFKHIENHPESYIKDSAAYKLEKAKIKKSLTKAHIIHFISKNFGLVFDGV